MRFSLRVAIGLVGAGLCLSSPATGHPVSLDVVAVLSQDLAPYRTAVEGIKADGTLRVTVLDLKGDLKEGAWIIRKIRSLKPDIIVSVGSLATVILGDEIRDIPVVFCMTTEIPEVARSSSNVTGVYLRVAADRQFKSLKQVIPGIGSIGVVYDAEHSSDLIAEAGRSARDMGLVLVERPVSEAREVPEALRSLVGKAESIWLIPDSTCFTRESFEFALKLSLEHRIPLMVFSEAYVRAGALLSLSPDYEGVGGQTARLVRRIHSGESIGTLLPEGPDDPVLVINRRTARNLGAAIASRALWGAARLVE